MKTQLCSMVALMMLAVAIARAQTPAPPPPAVPAAPAQQTGVAGDTRDQTKATSEGGRQQDQVRTMRNLGRTPSFPHQIKDEGLKMPKCAQESREGEACK